VNILYLHAHDAGRYLQPYGAAVNTPNLQRLAEHSVVFRQAHSAAPTCSPSRAALLTGRSPHATGMLGLAHRGFSLHQPEQHLAAFLGDHGWHTALAGIQHLHCGDGQQRPYQRELKPDKPTDANGAVDWKKHDSSVADRASKFLRASDAASSADTPFFLDCGFWYPHRPFPELEHDDTAPDFVTPPAGSVDSADTREDTARFLAAVKHMDACVGRVLNALETCDCRDDTLVLFTVDHGIAFPGHKCQLTDRGTGVALMLRLPRRFHPEAVSGTRDKLVSHLDVFPTICDLASLTPPDWLEGVSLKPLLTDPTEAKSEAAEVRSEVFSEVTWHAAYEPKRSIRTRSHRLILRFEPLQPIPANIDDSPAKTALLDAGWLGGNPPAVELYDLRLDPEESHDRADDPELAEVRADLERRLLKWMQETGDPLLDGTPQPPAGAVVDPPEQISPS
jgi:arylsulfatase A-like enzyme